MAAQSSILFEVLANILTGKSEKTYQEHINDELKWKTYPGFMVLRYLTMSTDSTVRQLIFDNYMQLNRLPAKVQYKWLLKNVPKLKSNWIKYIK